MNWGRGHTDVCNTQSSGNLASSVGATASAWHNAAVCTYDCNIPCFVRQYDLLSDNICKFILRSLWFIFCCTPEYLRLSRLLCHVLPLRADHPGRAFRCTSAQVDADLRFSKHRFRRRTFLLCFRVHNLNVGVEQILYSMCCLYLCTTLLLTIVQ